MERLPTPFPTLLAQLGSGISCCRVTDLRAVAFLCTKLAVIGNIHVLDRWIHLRRYALAALSLPALPRALLQWHLVLLASCACLRSLRPAKVAAVTWSVLPMRPNSSFKPTPLRSGTRHGRESLPCLAPALRS